MPAQHHCLYSIDSPNDQERQRDDEQNTETFRGHPRPGLWQLKHRQQEDDAEQRHSQLQRLFKNRNDDFAKQTGGSLGPKMHSFSERSNCPEDKPEKSNDRPRIKNVGERAGKEKASWSGDDAGNDRRKCESS